MWSWWTTTTTRWSYIGRRWSSPVRPATVFQSAVLAAAHMEQREPHVLVADVALPGESGYWLLEHVRALKKPPFVIAVTGRQGLASDVESALVLHKPVDPFQLV
jgi:DNA-binding response OmpR family regulator